MQSLMQKTTIAAILFVFFLSSAHADDTAAVPNPLNLRPSPATIQFVKVCAAYAKAVRDHGADGLKTFITPDFALGGAGPPLTGKAAVEELNACRVNLPGTCFSAAVRPLSVTELDVVALSHEVYACHLKLRGNNTLTALTYDWKQTWRKTAQGWNLAGMEPYREDFDKVQGITFTVLPEAKSEPAKTQAKQNVVK